MHRKAYVLIVQLDEREKRKYFVIPADSMTHEKI